MIILAVNPGSTSTKAALYRDLELMEELSITHDPEELNKFPQLNDQIGIRMDSVMTILETRGIKPGGLDAVIGRGGLMKPLTSGVYRVSPGMLEDLKECRFGRHASNLGAPMAQRLAEAYGKEGCPALIADPVVVDEMIPEARISGFPGIERRSIFHALNQKSVARQAAAILGCVYENLNLIVAHMGGGVSVGAHRKGRVIDVNNALDGDGPFSPERSGTVPAGQLLDRVESGISIPELRRGLTGEGGMAALYGSKDHKAMMEAFDSGDENAILIHRAMVLQIAQEICRHGATLEGKVDAIVLTGGLARSTRLTDDLKKKISFLGEVIVIPGEREMQSLAENAMAAVSGIREIKEYS